MGPDRYLPFLPTMLNWIQQTLDAHAGERRAVSSFKFTRLPHYFSEGLLNTASVVLTDRLPVPPLSALGLREFADFENQPMSGITYKDTSSSTSSLTPPLARLKMISAVGQELRIVGLDTPSLLKACGNLEVRSHRTILETMHRCDRLDRHEAH